LLETEVCMASLKKFLLKKQFIQVPLELFFKLTTKETKIKAAGAGATDMETRISTKNKIEIGEWQREKLKIVLFDLVHVNTALTTHDARPVDGIIGADILKKAKAVIDYSKHRLYLKNCS